MNVIVTYLALVCLTAVAIGIRLLWPRLGMRPRRQTFLVLAFLLLPALLSTVSRWDTTSTHLNASLLWIRIFAYEISIVFFTLIQPRLLTTIIAIVLLLPVFSSSIVGPASALFSTVQPSVRPIGGDYFLELAPWSSGPSGNTGADFTLFYQPGHFSFLRRPFMGSRLYGTQCLTSNTTATLDPATAHIAVHCPPLTSDPAAPPSGTELEYLIPSGARSAALARNQHR